MELGRERGENGDFKGYMEFERQVSPLRVEVGDTDKDCAHKVES